MPTPADIRAQILLTVRADGRTELDAAKQGFEQARDASRALERALKDGAISAEEFRKPFTKSQAEVRAWGKAVADLERPINQAIALQDEMAMSWGKHTAKFIVGEEKKAAAIDATTGKVKSGLSDAEKAALAKERLEDRIALEIGKRTAKIIVDDEKAADAKMAAVQKATIAVERASDRVNAILSKDRAREQKEDQERIAEAERVADAEIQDMIDVSTNHEIVMAKWDSAQIRAKNGVRGFKTDAEEAAEASKRFSYGILHVAHAIQDLQYGFGAVLNNIPLVVQAMGGSAGLAGGVMMAGVAVTVFGDKLKGFATSLGLMGDQVATAKLDMAGLEETIKQFEAKPMMFRVDYADLRMAREQLAQLKKEESDFQALKDQRTNLQEKVGKAFAEAVVEKAGGTDEESGAANLAKLVEEAKRRQGTLDTPATTGDRARLANLIKKQQSDRELLATNLLGAEERERLIVEEGGFAEEILAVRARIDAATTKAVEGLIARAKQGIGVAVDEVLNLVDAQADVFKKGVPGAAPVGEEFRAAVNQARPEMIKAVEAIDKANKEEEKQIEEAGRLGAEAARLQKEEEAKAKALKDQAAAAGKALVDRHAAALGGDKSIGGRIESETNALVAQGVIDPAQINAQLQAKVEQMVAAVGWVDKGSVAAVAAALLDKATETALGKIAGQAGDNETIVDVARRNAAEAQAKTAAKNAAKDARAAAKDVREQPAEDRAAIAAKLKARFPDVTDQQAMVGAETFQKHIKAGDNPALAQAEANAQMFRFVQQQAQMAAQVRGLADDVVATHAQATFMLEQLTRDIAAVRGKLRNAAVNKRMPAPVLPGG